MVDIEKVSGLSMDIEGANQEKLRAVFPECFNDGKLDIDKLLNLCGQYIENDYEKYKFEWPGKAECFKIAGKRSTGTLRPCREESVNFDTTKNLYIEGDNLEVLKLLQTSYFNKVKMIYIDPPYNTGNDFVYKDDFKDPIEKYKEITQQTTKSNPETMGRFHTNWLNMMFPRLRLAANLLRDDGVIFISIDDNEITNLRKLCDEVFGEENFLAQIVWQKKTSPDARMDISAAHDFIVVYTKNSNLENYIFNSLPYDEERLKSYKNPDNDPRGVWASVDITGQTGRAPKSQFYEITTPSGVKYFPPDGRCWAMAENTFKELLQDNRLWFGESGSNRPRLKKFLSESDGVRPWTWWDNKFAGHNQDGNKELMNLFDNTLVFDNPKPTKLIKKLVSLVTDNNNNDIILDFFGGSSTTAHSVLELNKEDQGNRIFITVQIPAIISEEGNGFKSNNGALKLGYKNICEIGKERIRRAGKKLIENTNGQLSLEEKQPLDIGFKVLKLDTSNLAQWDSTPTEEQGALFARLHEIENSVKSDRTDLDVVYEVMLKLGVPLDFPVQEIQINDKKAYSIGENCLVLVCIDYGKDGITPEDIEKMCDYLPAKIVSTQQAFKDDVSLSNTHYILKDRDIEIKLL